MGIVCRWSLDPAPVELGKMQLMTIRSGSNLSGCVESGKVFNWDNCLGSTGARQPKLVSCLLRIDCQIAICNIFRHTFRCRRYNKNYNKIR